MWRSPSPTNTSKIHPSVEQVSWKTGKRTPIQPRLQERFPCNQVGWEKESGEDGTLGKGLRGKGRPPRGYLPWEVSGLNHRLRVPVLGSCAEETSLLGCLENSMTERETGEPRLHLGGVCGCLLATRQGRKRSAPVAATSLCSWSRAEQTPQARPLHTTDWH